MEINYCDKFRQKGVVYLNLSNLLNNDITQDDYLRFKNATLLFKKLPIEVGGLIVRKNDVNVIIINDYLDESQKKEAFLHELVHLELDHTYKFRIVSNNRSHFEKDVDMYISNLKFD